MRTEHNTWDRATALPSLRALQILMLALGAFTGLIPSTLSAQPERTPADRSDAATLQSLWNDLSTEKAEVAQRAIDELLKSPDETLSMIERQFAPLLGSDGPQVKDLIRVLGDDDPARRASAQQQLAVLSKLIKSQLLQALQGNLPGAINSRVQNMLDSMKGPFARSEHDRRLVRVGTLLQKLDTSRSRQIFEIIEPPVDLEIVDSRLPPLHDLLTSSLPAARVVGAIRASELGEAAAPLVPQILKLLAEDGPKIDVGEETRSVADHVAAVLPKFGTPVIEPLRNILADTSAPLRVRTRAVTLLVPFEDEQTIPVLIKTLADGNQELQKQVSTALERLGPKAVPSLIDAIDGQNADVQVEAATILGKIDDDRAIPSLAKALRSENPNLRRRALQSLSKQGDLGIQELLAAWKSTEPCFRQDASLRVDLLSRLLSSQSIDRMQLINEALADEHEKVRSQALFRLGNEMGSKAAQLQVNDRLLTFLKDPSPEMRRMAAQLFYNQGLVHGGKFAVDRARLAEALIAAFDDPAKEVRRTAINASGTCRIQEAVDRLLQMLDANGPTTEVVTALGSIGDSRAVIPLRKHLTTRNPRVIVALGSLQDQESVPTIIEFLKAPDAEVRRSAIASLGRSKDHRGIDALIESLKNDPEHLDTIVDMLGRVNDPRIVGPLLDACRAYSLKPPFLRGDLPNQEADCPRDDRVAGPLVKLGVNAIEPVAQALNDPAVHVREVAAWVLYSISVERGIDAEDMKPAVEPLAVALKDDSAVVRNHAAMTLGRLKDPRAADALVQMVGEAENPDYLYSNARAYLGALRQPASVMPLIEMLKDPRPDVRSNAARTLGTMQDQQAIKPLLDSLQDPIMSVRKDAAYALAKLHAVEAVEPLIEMLKHKSPSMRQEIAADLGRMEDQRAIEPLVSLAQDKDQLVQLAAGIALVRLNDSRGLTTLAACLKHKDREQREQAFSALTYAVVRKESLVPLLAESLDDSSLKVRNSAAFALSFIANQAAADALLKKLDDRENLRMILGALASTKDSRAFEVMLEHLNDPDEKIRASVASNLGGFNSEYFTDARLKSVISHLTDPSAKVRLEIIRLMVTLKPRQAIEPLTAALQDENAQVRMDAARALKRIKP